MGLNFSISRTNVADLETDLLALTIFKDSFPLQGTAAEVDRSLDGIITRLFELGELKTKPGKLTLIHTPVAGRGKFKPLRLLLVGAGAEEQFDLAAFRTAIAASVRKARDVAARSMAVLLPGDDAQTWASALAEGALLGLYRFNKYKEADDNREKPEPGTMFVLDVGAENTPAAQSGFKLGQVLADSAVLARDLVNEPANVMTPTAMARSARAVAERGGAEFNLLERDDVRKLGMNAFLGVAQGSAAPPKFVHLAYNGDPSSPRNVWLIGKSITFDTGGISLKPAPKMGEMKADMAGGAAVIGAMQGIAELKLKLNVHAACAITENMPGGNAQRPGDIVRAMNGVSIEVDNTDAEGRLTLADAVCYAKSKGAAAIVDVATLTGAIRVGLGRGHSGGYGNNDLLMQELEAAAERAGEPICHLPIDEWAREQNRSAVADIKNTGGAYAGAMTAAHFIGRFVGDTPWAHIDIAGTGMLDKPRGIYSAGATGVMARTLVQFAIKLSQTPDWSFLKAG